ncbi:phage protease [Micromonosporaceae bacterium Da 78-11]
MPDVELARRPGVELVRTGRFQTLTGSWNPTPADIKAAVEAMDCPAIRKPVIRIGHTDKRFQISGDGEPALGWFENLRAADGGNTLVADQVTLPWLHSVQAAAYPSRSIEGNYNHRCSENHVHPFVIHTVALLGVTPPGVQTLRSLNDLPEMLGVAASSEVPEGAEPVQVTVMAAGEGHTGAMVALIPSAEDASRLAVVGGEPADELHVTLAYLGDATALGAHGQQDIIDAVSSAANGLPVIEADAFAVSIFNPPGVSSDDGKQRDTCIVLGLSGDIIDAVHDLISHALADSPMPAQHRPWVAHTTLIYTDDVAQAASLVDRTGPVTFDKLRLAFAGEHVDIPLIATDGDAVAAALAWFDKQAAAVLPEEPVAASDPAETALVSPPASGPAPVLPAAEPEQVINPDPKEDLVSTDLSVFRSRLGLDDTADEVALLAAFDAALTKAETPVEPTPEMVAASAAVETEKDELRKEVQVLASQMQTMSTELASTKAEKAATVKASVFDAAIKEGKLKPADRELWEKDYDEAPGAITRVLASIAPGTAVPVMASGVAGSPEPTVGDDEWDSLTALLDGPNAKAV